MSDIDRSLVCPRSKGFSEKPLDLDWLMTIESQAHLRINDMQKLEKIELQQLCLRQPLALLAIVV
jgi:hypothetical protein